ncbi:LRR receptor-like serine/threonine-protein kinase FLS2 [Prosopis cineraria]|uniref:LRR receptor-like serine/threonine-protein kinase FLS2 n=1 Tax=Prosopis cineraria TaxID=364024 RepID=UPI0024106DB9|nr:LRR receptor-like serine/threonine-protein kinase FLS2 [Prosopis cineraria]
MANLRFHFSFSMFLLLCLMIHPTCCHTNFSTDELALRAFRFSVRDPYNHLDDWSNSSSICNWVGVTCDSNYGRVRILDLSEMSLKRTLPSQIGNLSFLVKLYLHSNNFYGELPKELFQLRKLEILNLSYNAFNGVIPTWIGSLSALQHLILNNNSLDGVIPSSISNLSKLESLECRSNFIKGSIPFEIGRLGRLKILRISVNNLSRIIPSAISNLSSLERMILSYNSLSGNIPETIGALTNPKIISLSFNKLSGQIPRTIGNLTLLQELSLDHNNLEGSIPSDICHGLQNVQALHLQANGLSGALPSKWIQCKELKYLQLEYNSFTEEIPKTIGIFIKLKNLSLGVNKLSGQMPKSIGNLTVLQELYLDANNLEGSIPKAIGGLLDLQYLDLQGNELHGLIIDEDILRVNLSSNILVGNVSLRIGNLNALVALDLSRNHISGFIPTTLGGLKNLQDLSLAHNNLQGNIPESFKNMLSLVKLDLFKNNLSGKIPKSLKLLIDLQYVNLSYNKLQGEIPSGGVFKNLTPESFMMNQAHCGVILLRHKRQQNSTSLVRRDLSILGVPIRISYFEIQEATNGFDESNILGRGSYGSVFKGKLSNGIIIVVKIFKFDSQVTLRSFEKECDILRNARHRNLVKVISCCSNVDFKSLVMEFMANGSLEKWLYSHNYFLGYFQRLNIMINVATALEYLHHGLLTPIVHCDLKPSNILMDDEMHLWNYAIRGVYKKKAHRRYVCPTEDMFVEGLNLKSWVVRTGCKAGRMFELTSMHLPEITVPTLCTASTSSSPDSSLDLWHHRLAHPYLSTISQYSCPYTSQQNGRAKHKHRHILDSTRALLISSCCPERFWGEAAITSGNIKFSSLTDLSSFSSSSSPIFIDISTDLFPNSLSTDSSIELISMTDAAPAPDMPTVTLIGLPAQVKPTEPILSTNSRPNRSDNTGVQELKIYLVQQFKMKDLGKLNYFLGIEVHHESDGISLSQVKYATNLISRAHLSDEEVETTPIEPNVHYTTTDGTLLDNPTRYR